MGENPSRKRKQEELVTSLSESASDYEIDRSKRRREEERTKRERKHRCSNSSSRRLKREGKRKYWDSNESDSGAGQEHCDANLSLPSDNATAYIADLSLPVEADTIPKRRVIGPAMPSAELIATAAKLTEAQAELRDIEMKEDTDLFIGPAPPPPDFVTEVESANEIECFEEATRIIASDADNSYDVLGANRNMLNDNITKQYLKLSRMVHPEAHHAFIKLNKAFKDLQDLDKRKVLDEKIKQKEEQEEMKAELQAAQWRRLQVALKSDEWMTTLPPERKSGVVRMYSTTRFSKSSKEGCGDTSAWTDTSSVRAQKDHLEASTLTYKERQEKSRSSVDAELVVHYNKTRRSKSMVEKHQETAARIKS